MLDWDDGEYERTAATLTPAAALACERLGLAPGLDVLDLGCGTGNAALEAARTGARVVGLDPAPRLLATARARAEASGLDVRWVLGDAMQLPFDDASFDRIASIFAIIFAPDAVVASRELVRVLRPGGRAVLTSWKNEGPIAEIGTLLVTELFGPRDVGRDPTPRWGERDDVRALFADRGVDVSFEEHGLPFRAESATAWFDDQERHHPVWRLGRGQLGARWDVLRERSIAILEAGNETPGAFLTTSRYELVTLEKR
jgi:SAM-dependent methyltransferase